MLNFEIDEGTLDSLLSSCCLSVGSFGKIPTPEPISSALTPESNAIPVLLEEPRFLNNDPLLVVGTENENDTGVTGALIPLELVMLDFDGTLYSLLSSCFLAVGDPNKFFVTPESTASTVLLEPRFLNKDPLLEGGKENESGAVVTGAVNPLESVMFG